jgi:ankyrin repeat protein
VGLEGVDRYATVTGSGQAGRVSNGPQKRCTVDDSALLTLLGAIASRDHDEVIELLNRSPDLATRRIQRGATREDPDTYFLVPIRHHVYRDDTALHVAAAAHQRDVCELLVAGGAVIRAANRRGAEPLHYAADGGPRAEPRGQREVIAYLISKGADPNAPDKSGVAPIHRAVRTRSSGAVSALIEHGADPRLPNKKGSTPLHLAVQNTGKSGSGSDAAKREQARIIDVLLQHGATPTDSDANGKTVAAAATSDWIRELLGTI